MNLVFTSLLLAFLTEAFASLEVSNPPLDVSSVTLETDVPIEQVDFENETLSTKILLLYQFHRKMVSFATKYDVSKACVEIDRVAEEFFVMLDSLQSIHLRYDFTEEFITELYRYVFLDPFFVIYFLNIIPYATWYFNLYQIKYLYIDIFKKKDLAIRGRLFFLSLDKLKLLADSNFSLESLCPLYNALLMKCELILKTRLFLGNKYYDLEKCRDNGFSSFPTRPKEK